MVVGGSTVALLLQLLAWLGVADVRTALVWTLALTWLAGVSAIVTGLTDFKDTASGDERNMVGLHGLVNIVATLALIGAFVALLARADGLAGWLIVAGFLILSVGAFIGGHVVFKYGYMVNRNAFARGKSGEGVHRRPAGRRPARCDPDPGDARRHRAGGGAPRRPRLRAEGHLLARGRPALQGPPGRATRSSARGTPPPSGCATARSAMGRPSTRQVAYRARINGDQVEVQGPID